MELIPRLEAIVGAANVMTEPTACAPYVHDWTGRYSGDTPAVVLPGSPEEVSAVLRLCNDARVAIVPQGGNTGQVGGSVPLHGEVTMSLRRLTRVDTVNTDVPSVTVGAGVTLAGIVEVAEPHGLTFGIDLTPKNEATIGGMVATNAAGLRFVRHGPMRNQLLGLEVVLPDGTIASHLRGLPKDNTGYDIPSIFCGSEGTLGVITAATLRFVPIPPNRAAALFSVATFAEALEIVRTLRSTSMLEAAEVMFPNGIQLVADYLGCPPPLDSSGPYLLVELTGTTDVTPILREALQTTTSRRILAQSAEERERLWRWRTNYSMAIGQYCRKHKLSPPQKYDLSLPMQESVRFLTTLNESIKQIASDAIAVVFGHIGDGNLHVNILGKFDDSVSVRLDQSVLQLAIDHGGSISAEHGIGTSKSQYLSRYRSPAELDLFARLKQAFDPNGILNPHVL